MADAGDDAALDVERLRADHVAGLAGPAVGRSADVRRSAHGRAEVGRVGRGAQKEAEASRGRVGGGGVVCVIGRADGEGRRLGRLGGCTCVGKEKKRKEGGKKRMCMRQQEGEERRSLDPLATT